jgi:adenosylcobinamide-GDP ribazoletransferase
MTLAKADEPDTAPARTAGETPFILREWKAFVTAVEFLTRVPLSSPAVPKSPADLARCPLYFPLVGALLGALTSALAGGFSVFWPTWLAALLAVAVEAWLTGGLHEDGVADFCDAFGGGWSKDDVLRILEDSRIGTFGALGLVFAVAIRAGAIAVLIEHEGKSHWLAWGAAITASASVSRWIAVLAEASVPPVPLRDSLARDLRSERSWWLAGMSALWTIPPLSLFIAFMPIRSVVAAAMLLGFVWWLLRKIRASIGGITGDCCGFLIYMCQILILLAAAARMPP